MKEHKGKGMGKYMKKVGTKAGKSKERMNKAVKRHGKCMERH